MDPTIVYGLKVILCSGVFYLLYRLLFERRVNYAFCRIYLVSTIAISAAIPAVTVPVWPGEVIEVPLSVMTLQQMPGVLPATVEIVTESGKWTVAFLPAVYAVVALFFIACFIIQLFEIRRYKKNARKSLLDRIGVYEGAVIKTPFTFFRSIFIPCGLADEEKQQIIAHESSHASHNHSLELTIMELLKAGLWFDPFVWLCRKSLVEVHEYEADNAVIEKGHDPYNYKNLLFRQLFGYSPDISNGLACSGTKKRLMMMDRKKPGRRSILRAAAMVPVAGALLMLFSFTKKDTSIVYIDDRGAEHHFDMGEMMATDIYPTEIIITGSGNGTINNAPLSGTEGPGESSPDPDTGGSVTYYRTMAAFNLLDGEIPDQWRQEIEQIKDQSLSADWETFRKQMEELDFALEATFGEQIREWAEMRESFDQEFHNHLGKLHEFRESIGDDEFRRQMERLGSIREAFETDAERILNDLLSRRESIKEGTVREWEQNRDKDLYRSDTDKPKTKIPSDGKNPLVIIDGKKGNLHTLSEDDIKSISVLKNDAAIEKYGQEAKDGVIIVTKKSSEEIPPQPEEPFIAVEKMPTFEDGNLADFGKWVTARLNEKFPEEQSEGTATVNFIVEKTGEVTGVKILQNTLPEQYLPAIEEIVGSSPAWTPGMQRGHDVRVSLTIPISLR